MDKSIFIIFHRENFFWIFYENMSSSCKTSCKIISIAARLNLYFCEH